LPITEMAKSASKPTRPVSSRPADQYVNSSFFYKMEKEIEERRHRIQALQNEYDYAHQHSLERCARASYPVLRPEPIPYYCTRPEPVCMMPPPPPPEYYKPLRHTPPPAPICNRDMTSDVYVRVEPRCIPPECVYVPVCCHYPPIEEPVQRPPPELKPEPLEVEPPTPKKKKRAPKPFV